jgi:hypothetical protein
MCVVAASGWKDAVCKEEGLISNYSTNASVENLSKFHTPWSFLCCALQDFVRHSGSTLPLLAGSSRDQAFTNIIWALGCWEHVPPREWLQEYCRYVSGHMFDFVTDLGFLD